MITDVRMSRAIEAVEIDVRIGPQLLTVLVAPDALEEHFHAAHAAISWLEACNANAQAIEAAVLKRWQATRKNQMFLTTRDF